MQWTGARGTLRWTENWECWLYGGKTNSVATTSSGATNSVYCTATLGVANLFEIQGAQYQSSLFGPK